MRRAVILAILLQAALVGCDQPNGREPQRNSKGDHYYGGSVNVNNAFGRAQVSVISNLCAGRAVLVQGSATIEDGCFTGDTNIVVCTDVSSANPLRCAPQKGSLLIEGHSGDTISYARVR